MSENPPPPPPPSAPPPPPDPYQQGAYQQEVPKGSGLAIAALVIGILSLPAIFTVFGGIILGLIAVVLGFVALRKVKNGTAGGRGMAITGVVLGFIGVIAAVAILVIAAIFVNSDTGKNLRDCLQNAGDDQSAQQQCQDDFRDKLQN